MTSNDQNNVLASKTDEEIQEELLSIKQKFYNRMDTQLEKDLILEEREKLAMEKRNLDIQKEFLKQKMKKVYGDQHDIEEEVKIPPEKLFYDITKNGPPITPPVQEQDDEVVPQRKSRWIHIQNLDISKSKFTKIVRFINI